MDILTPRCCGLDVHKKTVVACRRLQLPNGRTQSLTRTFGTSTKEILALADWLVSSRVTHVAMEATGVYWKPVWNVLEGQFELLLVNARDIKQAPGRKTDVKDCERIAQLLRHGLLRPSFVPPKAQRDLRDLTRQRVQLIDEQNRVANRIQKVLEDANVKLASVASDVLGKSGRRILTALIDGTEDPAALAELALGRLRGKIPELREALHGRVTDHHRFMLESHLEHFASLQRLIDTYDRRVEDLCRPFTEQIRLLMTLPGSQQRTAENMLAEIGNDMSRFPSAGHIASWTGICPGNNESAGKRKSGKIRHGNRWLRRTLILAAWGAARTKETYTQAQFRRLASRRGRKRALVAVSHTLLRAAYHMLRDRVPYNELGPGHFDNLNHDRLTRYHVKRLEALGHQVNLEPAA
jgi:transposase